MTQLPRVRFPEFPKIFPLKKIVNVAEVNQQHCLEESGQWLENVDQTQLVMASGYQKKLSPMEALKIAIQIRNIPSK